MKLPGTTTVLAILFTYVTKLQKFVPVRRFHGINEEKKRITNDAISHR